MQATSACLHIAQTYTHILLVLLLLSSASHPIYTCTDFGCIVSNQGAENARYLRASLDFDFCLWWKEGMHAPRRPESKLTRPFIRKPPHYLQS